MASAGSIRPVRWAVPLGGTHSRSLDGSVGLSVPQLRSPAFVGGEKSHDVFSPPLGNPSGDLGVPSSLGFFCPQT
jgi:hypothetical protein